MAEQVLEAMNIQKRAVRSLAIIAAEAVRISDRELLSAVRREDRRHYYLLEGIYEDLTGKGRPAYRAAVSLPKNYHDMLKTAICDKLSAVEYFEELEQQIRCVKQKELLKLIINDQKEHARILAGLYDRAI